MDKSEVIKTIESQLTVDQQQLLKDTINYGCWGDCDQDFLNANGERETVSAMGYCTNDAKEATHFKGRTVSSMFRAIYKKLCPNGIGQYLSHCTDWWGDGSGDMLFIRSTDCEEVEAWARN